MVDNEWNANNEGWWLASDGRWYPPVAQIPAGWKPDPLDPNMMRWWDGLAWTQHIHAHQLRHSAIRTTRGAFQSHPMLIALAEAETVLRMFADPSQLSAATSTDSTGTTTELVASN